MSEQQYKENEDTIEFEVDELDFDPRPTLDFFDEEELSKNFESLVVDSASPEASGLDSNALAAASGTPFVVADDAAQSDHVGSAAAPIQLPSTPMSTQTTQPETLKTSSVEPLVTVAKAPEPEPTPLIVEEPRKARVSFEPQAGTGAEFSPGSDATLEAAASKASTVREVGTGESRYEETAIVRRPSFELSNPYLQAQPRETIKVSDDDETLTVRSNRPWVALGLGAVAAVVIAVIGYQLFTDDSAQAAPQVASAVPPSELVQEEVPPSDSSAQAEPEVPVEPLMADDLIEDEGDRFEEPPADEPAMDEPAIDEPVEAASMRPKKKKPRTRRAKRKKVEAVEADDSEGRFSPRQTMNPYEN